MLQSKRWLHLRTTVPCLEFSPHHRPIFYNNLNTFERFVSGKKVNSYEILAQVLVAVRETNSNFKLGAMNNLWKDLVILRSLGIVGNVAAPRKAVSVSWWPPLPGWIKVNTDGSASGSPGNIHAGGVFRNASNLVMGCFHVDGGVGFAFEAELLAVITTVENSAARGWHHLWIKVDSTYVVGLLETRSHKVPWRFAACWGKILALLASFELRVSHIFREGNSVADIMASPTTEPSFGPHSIPIIEEAVGA